MDVKHTTAGVNDVGYTLATDRNRFADIHSTFEIQDLCSHIEEEDVPQANALADLDARTRALIRPYMTIDATLTQTDESTVQLHNSLLLDSGSLDGSYIGAGTLRDYPNIIRQEQKTNRTVYMADKKTVCL